MIYLIKLPEMFKTSEIHFTNMHLTKAMGKAPDPSICFPNLELDLVFPILLEFAVAIRIKF